MLLQHYFLLTKAKKKIRYRMGNISHLCSKLPKDYSSNKGLTKRNGAYLIA